MDYASKRWNLARAGLCGLTLLAYANSFGAGFTLDNRGLLLEDPRVRAATAENVGLILQHTYWWPYGESGLYRPFTTLTYLFNYAVVGNGGWAAGYHWINLLLHAGNVLLVLALARRLLKGFWPPVLLAAVWAVHPVLTESVTNMVGRADLLAGMAVIGGLLLYLKSAEASGARRVGWLAALAAVTTVGVFSKESAVTLLGVMALYELAWWKGRQRIGAAIGGWIAVALPVGAMLAQRASVLARSEAWEKLAWDNPLVAMSFWQANLTAMKVAGRHLGLLIWPAKLSCDYSFAQIAAATGSVTDWAAWIGVALAAGCAAAMDRRNRAVFFFAGMAVVTWLPTSNLLFPIGTIMAERFLYLPAIAAAACVVAGIFWCAERVGAGKLTPLVLGVVVAMLGIRTWVRNRDWRDDLSLAQATVQSSPNSYKAHKMLATALYEADSSHGNIDSVIGESEKSLAILNGLPDAWNNPDSYRRAARYYVDKGEGSAYGKARELLERTLAIVRATDARTGYSNDARVPDLYRTISAVCLRMGDASGALAAAEDGLKSEPLAAASYGQLAAALVAGNRADEAAVALMEGILLTADRQLREGLVSLYRQGVDRQGCAILAGSAGLNRECAMVHRHLCQASAAAIQTRLAAGQRDAAEQVRESAVRDFGCGAPALR
jgi:protein O-mannosyl-transferase